LRQLGRLLAGSVGEHPAVAVLQCALGPATAITRGGDQKPGRALVDPGSSRY
jgi:hypothetical protein